MTFNIHKKRATFGAFFVCSLCAFLFCNSCTQQLRNTSQPLPAKHFLWKVQKNGSELWLLGSIHMAPQSLYPLAPALEQAFAHSSEVAVEINIAEDSTLTQVTRAMVQRGSYAAGDRLEKHIRPELMNQMDSLFAAWDLPVKAMHGMRPWFLAIRLGDIAAERSGVTADEGVDLHFLDEAKRTHKPVRSLETVAEQMNVFFGMEDSLQELLLQYTLQESTDLQTSLDTMFTYWKTGDTLGLARIARSDLDDPRFKVFAQRLYYDRNIHMAQQIESYLTARRKVLVIVGSAHLVGEGSVVRLLRKHGYTVTQQ